MTCLGDKSHWDWIEPLHGLRLGRSLALPLIALPVIAFPFIGFGRDN